MYLYILFLAIAIFTFYEVAINKKDKYSGFTFNIFLLILFTLSFIRWDRGTDWDQYCDFFENLRFWDDPSRYELGYEYLNKIIKLTFELNYTVLLFTLAIILYFCYNKVIKKYSTYLLVSLLVWFSLNFGSIFFVRQEIAIAILFASFIFIEKRRFWPFLIMVILAGGFHISAYPFVFAYFLSDLRLSKKTIINLLVFSFIIGISFSSVLLSGLGNLIGGDYAERIDIYLSFGMGESFGSAYSPIEFLIKGTINRIVILIIIILFIYSKFYDKDRIFRYTLNLYVVGCSLFFVTAPLSQALVRITNYFEVFQILLYPYILLGIKNKQTRLFCLILIIAYLLLRFYIRIQGYEDLYIPFKTIFNKELPVEVY